MRIRYKSKNEQALNENNQQRQEKAYRLLSEYRSMKKQSQGQCIQFQNQKLQALWEASKKVQSHQQRKFKRIKYTSMKSLSILNHLNKGIANHNPLNINLQMGKKTYNLTFENRKFWSVQPIHLKEDKKISLSPDQRQKNIRSRKISRQTQRFSSESCQRLQNVAKSKQIPKFQNGKTLVLQISGLKAPTSQTIDHLHTKKLTRQKQVNTLISSGYDNDRDHYLQFFQ